MAMEAPLASTPGRSGDADPPPPSAGDTPLFMGFLRGPHLGKAFCFSGKETHWLSEDSVLGLRLYGFTVPAPVLSPPSTCVVLDLSRRLCKMGSLVVLPHRIGVRMNSVNTHEKLRRAHGKHSVSMGNLHYSPSALTGSVTSVS